MKLNIITCATDSIRERWECRVLLNNLQEQGLLNKTTLLIFQMREDFLEAFHEDWDLLEKQFPEANFVYFKDHQNITRLCQIFHYIPLFRLYVLQEHFKTNPQLEQEAIFYIDTDILITKPLPFEKWLEGDINYLSWTGNPQRTDNYLWQPYFDSKIKEVDHKKLEQYKKQDILAHVANICGTTREAITLNSPNIGGAQYLLKNINSQFWTNCFNYACEIKLYLEGTNITFMNGDTFQKKQDNGFQAFCADMWAVMFQLIALDRPVQCPKELDFSWSCDRIERYEQCHLLHNAGITSDAKVRVAFEKLPDGSNKFEEAPLFYKGAYMTSSPFENIEELKEIYNNPLNKQFCNNKYVEAILKTKEYE